MKRNSIYSIVVATIFLVSSLLILQGCAKPAQEPSTSSAGGTATGQQANSAAPTSTAETPVGANDLEHGHIPGAHGGFIVAIGRDSYHAEAIFEKDGAISLYMLGADESRINEVDNQTLTAYVKSSSTAEATPMELKPAPQEGDSEGKTSRFAGTMPESLWGMPVEVTIPVIRIGNDRFRLGFNSAVQAHGDAAMPTKVSSQEEIDLYLTPGGIYTQADIEANGNMTASQKFAGFMSAHDMNPKVGDKICPITLTLANAQCAWIIGGKNYEFCCPPCVDEFVKTAKTAPENIKAPEDYVKQ